MAKPLLPPIITTSITIDDTSGPARRSVPAKAGVNVLSQQLRLEFERSNGSSGWLDLPLDALTRALDTVGPTQPPRCATAWTVADRETSRTHGPYTNQATAQGVARSTGNGDAVSPGRYVMWHDSDGLLWGLSIVGQPVRVYEAAPEEAELEAVLAKLDAVGRAVVEKALAARR